MPIQSGTHLGPYEIISAIGAGGMGEVYRAHDPKLGRDVAIKVLPEAFARDAERMARFQREAKVLASLSHPNIATIYGLEDSGSTSALVMELVEGPTLADRIKAGPIPVDEAVRIAKQIADALEYAHERGIIHRDLKPANVKVTKDDNVKVLDFGLAKALEGDPSSIDISTSPTISRMATQQGVLLGTAAYMSPEQAKAKSVDRRADIWAFGCVLYEMLTGKVAFPGDSVTDTLAGVIRAEPDWSLLPATTPMRIRVLLQRCLQKDPKQRLRDIGDARISLDEVLSGAPDVALVGASQAVEPRWRRTLSSVGTAALGLVAVYFAFLHFREKLHVPTVPVQRYEFDAPDPSVNLVGALSPDGTRLVLRSLGGSGPRLWLRRMDSLEAHPIAGTEGVNGNPFWSPDNRSIAFGTGDGKLKKVNVEGGSPEVLCDAGNFFAGGFWTRDGKIFFGDYARLGLWEVPATGGVCSPLPGLEHTDRPASAPLLLPDGRHFLYSVGDRRTSGDVYIGSLDSKPGQQSLIKLLTGIAPGAAYVQSPDDPDLGYLLFVRGTPASAGTLTAQPFDLRKLELVGEPTQLSEPFPGGNFSVSLTGTLVYGSASAAATTGQLALFDRRGKIVGTVGEPGNYAFVALSPDGKRVVTTRTSESGMGNLWMMDLARGISTRFTFGAGYDGAPIWSPDGRRIVFTSGRSGHFDLYQKPSNGGGEEEPLLEPLQSNIARVSHSWSGDGRFVAYGEGDISQATERVLPLDKDAHATGKPFLFVQEGAAFEAKFSPGPQGRPLWVAYTSHESGRNEIYVRPFDPNSPTGTPPGGGKWQVSTEGGVSARWNSNGKELFYVALDGAVMSVEVSGGTEFQSGTPRPLFMPKGVGPQPTAEYYNWDASSDGTKFIFALSQPPSAPAPPPRFTVVLNWPSLLKK